MDSESWRKGMANKFHRLSISDEISVNKCKFDNKVLIISVQRAKSRHDSR